MGRKTVVATIVLPPLEKKIAPNAVCPMEMVATIISLEKSGSKAGITWHNSGIQTGDGNGGFGVVDTK